MPGVLRCGVYLGEVRGSPRATGPQPLDRDLQARHVIDTDVGQTLRQRGDRETVVELD